jgi:uncharacterized protein DUF3806
MLQNSSSAFLPRTPAHHSPLAALDRAFAAWLPSEPAAAEINAIINCVAIAFGQALVDKAGLQWVVATDEHGAELAVHGLPNRGDVLVYPANSWPSVGTAEKAISLKKHSGKLLTMFNQQPASGPPATHSAQKFVHSRPLRNPPHERQFSRQGTP